MAKRIKRTGELVRWNTVNGIKEGTITGVSVIYTVDTGKGTIQLNAVNDLLEDSPSR